MKDNLSKYNLTNHCWKTEIEMLYCVSGLLSNLLQTLSVIRKQWFSKSMYLYLDRFLHCIWNFRMSDVVKINLHIYWICFLWKWGKTKKYCYYLCKFITVLCDQVAWFGLYGIVIHYIRVFDITIICFDIRAFEIWKSS